MKKRFMVSDKKGILSAIFRLIVFSAVVFIAVTLLLYPGEAKDSIISSIKICSDTVIPSLFPFLFLSAFICESGLFEKDSRVLSFFSQKLFGCGYEEVCVFVMSAVGGFPVGAKAAKEILSEGVIGRNSARRLILSCINPSPAFAVTAVGLSVFSNTKTGLIIYSSVVISNLVIFFLTRFIYPSENEKRLPSGQKRSLSLSFVRAGSKASESMISICCYVLLFSCLCDVMKNYINDEVLLSSLCAFCEVTIGTQKLSFLSNIPLIAGVIGWGGLSVHFQIMDCITETDTDLKLFFATRAVCAFLSVLICDGLLHLFPQAQAAVALKSGVIVSGGEKSLPVSVMMLLGCFIFLIGDYTIKIKRDPERTNI